VITTLPLLRSSISVFSLLQQCRSGVCSQDAIDGVLGDAEAEVWGMKKLAQEAEKAI
jgi:hypothetical protein